MYVCIYIYIHTYIYIDIHTFTHITYTLYTERPRVLPPSIAFASANAAKHLYDLIV